MLSLRQPVDAVYVYRPSSTTTPPTVPTHLGRLQSTFCAAAGALTADPTLRCSHPCCRLHCVLQLLLVMRVEADAAAAAARVARQQAPAAPNTGPPLLPPPVLLSLLLPPVGAACPAPVAAWRAPTCVQLTAPLALVLGLLPAAVAAAAAHPAAVCGAAPQPRALAAAPVVSARCVVTVVCASAGGCGRAGSGLIRGLTTHPLFKAPPVVKTTEALTTFLPPSRHPSSHLPPTNTHTLRPHTETQIPTCCLYFCLSFSAVASFASAAAAARCASPNSAFSWDSGALRCAATY